MAASSSVVVEQDAADGWGSGVVEFGVVGGKEKDLRVGEDGAEGTSEGRAERREGLLLGHCGTWSWGGGGEGDREDGAGSKLKDEQDGLVGYSDAQVD